MSPISAQERIPDNNLARLQSGALFEVGTLDYVDASLGQTLHENYVARGWRKLDSVLADNPDATDYISAETAQQKYGLDGNVKFDGPVRESVAQTMFQQAQDKLDREAVLSRGHGLIQKGAGLTASIGASLLDPVNIALAFIPIVGEARYVQLLGALGKGALTAERAAELVKVVETGTAAQKLLAVREIEASAGFLGRFGARSVVGAGNAGVGNVGLGYVNSFYEGTPYYADDAGRDFAFGAVLGAGLHAIPGIIGDHFRGLHAETPALMGKSAIADVVKGEEVHSPGKIAELDAQRAYDQAKNDPEIVRQYGSEPREYTPGSFDTRTRVEGMGDLHNLPAKEYVDRRISELLPEEIAKAPVGEKTFSNSYDQAAFVATSNQPKLAAQALEWLKTKGGLTNEEIIARGKELRTSFKKGTELSDWTAARTRLEATRERDVEQALLQGQFVSPDRLKEFPALSQGYKDALPTLQASLDRRISAAGKQFAAEERAKAVAVSRFNNEREQAILAKRDAILAERGKALSDQVSTEKPKGTFDQTPDEKNTPSVDKGEETLKKNAEDPEAELKSLQEDLTKLKQDSSHALDEGTLTELKELDAKLADINSIKSKLKELASCVWSNL